VGQDKETGARASEYGHTMAAKVARFLDTHLLSKASNEADLSGKRVVIKCARQKTPEIGVSLAMLERVHAIIAAIEDENGGYALYKVDPQWYKAEMSSSRSHSPSAHKVMMVSCNAIREKSEVLGKMNADFEEK